MTWHKLYSCGYRCERTSPSAPRPAPPPASPQVHSTPHRAPGSCEWKVGLELPGLLPHLLCRLFTPLDMSSGSWDLSCLLGDTERLPISPCTSHRRHGAGPCKKCCFFRSFQPFVPARPRPRAQLITSLSWSLRILQDLLQFPAPAFV